MEFIVNNLWWIALALLSGGALLWPALQQRGSQLTLLQATQLMNQDKAVIIDIRQPAEFAASHLREAKNIPLAELPKRISELERFKSKAVIVVCATGALAPKAVAQLKKAGFGEVFALGGGLSAWQAQGLPLAK